jgi:hypothetical protein
MAGIYRQRHPEHTVFYRVFFYYFEKFLREYEDRLLCPACGGQMRIISFIEDPKSIDKIIRHLKLSFQAERPPPSYVASQELLMAAEEQGEYF